MKTRNVLCGLMSGLLLLAAGTATAQISEWDPTPPVPNALLALDKVDYQPGATANISGTGFQPLEAVTLQVLHADGTSDGGADHQPWTVNADADGNIVSTWHVCEDDCLNSELRLSAIGNTSGFLGAITFSDGIVANGNFETGNLLGWSTVSSSPRASWVNYSGTVSPISGHWILAPPEGTRAAVSDQRGPSYQILFQDLVLEPACSHTLTFKVYYKNWYNSFVIPGGNVIAVNGQYYRVDIIKPTASIRSLAPADVLATPFKTIVGDPATLAPTLITVNLSAFAGTTVRLRFTEVDSLNFFNAGVDDVQLTSVPLNKPPVANCKDVTVFAGCNNIEADASINDGSSDPDGDDLTLVQEPPGPYALGTTEVTLTVTDPSGASDSCTATVTVLADLFATDGIVWHQPLARNGMSEDTDPGAGGTLKYRFKLGSTIPIKVHAQGCNADVTGNANVTGTVVVFGDTDCDGTLDAGELPIDYNGVGEAGGVMDKIDGHLKYNLDTKKLPQTVKCYILQVTITDSSTGESRVEIVPLQAK